MKNIESGLLRYLGKKTQYAFQIVGFWGRGKTHFYRNILEPLISNTPTFLDDNKKYKPIYVSLFGAKSVEKLQIDIFNDLLYSRFTTRKLGKNVLSVSSRLSKLIFSGYLSFSGLENAKDYVAEISDIAREHVKPTDLFVCFDDLERISPSLSIEEFAGYVNVLVEAGVKVLIIYNEDKIDAETYKKYKEKIVGVSYDYNPSPDEIVDQIIRSRYAGDKIYSSALQEYKKILIDLVSKNDHNYRLLIYSLDVLHDIYSAIKMNILDVGADYSTKLKEELPSICTFIVASSMEFKLSAFNYADADRMKNMNWTLHELLEDYYKSKPEKVEDDPSKLFIDKYYPEKQKYFYYESIFGFVTGAKEFDIKDFEEEFKKHFHLENGKTTPEYQVLERLEYWQVLDLDMHEYSDSTRQMINYAKEGKYHLIEYLTVYHYVQRFDNLLKLDLDQLKEELIGAMSEIANNHEKMKGENTSVMQWEALNESENNLAQIRRHGINIITSFKQALIKEKEEKFNSTFENDLNQLQQRYHDDENFKRYIDNSPIFNKINIESFLNQLTSTNPSSILMLKSIFKDRYNYNITFEMEAEALKKITDFLKDQLESVFEENTIQTWMLKELYSSLMQIRRDHS